MRTVIKVRVPHGWMTFIYHPACLVMHPDILDAVAILDAACDVDGNVLIEGFGVRVAHRVYVSGRDRGSDYMQIDYNLCERWRPL